ncbi:MAG TPA: hypothetical protein VMN56_01585 [Casimicrobiaceae bacterium]|nr:hypothetical protein [Casimicrobiaceae bacterium]
MKKLVLIATVGGVLATAAVAQTTPAPPSPTADMQRMMEIRNWQTGPSSGDAANKADTATQGASDQKKASDLQNMMEIRGWQTGPSSGDNATKAASTAAAPPVDLGAQGTNQALIGASTP